MKRKASQDLSKEGTGGVEEGDEGRQVASAVTEIDPNGDLQMDFVVRVNDKVIYTDDDVVRPNDNVVSTDDDVVVGIDDVVHPNDNVISTDDDVIHPNDNVINTEDDMVVGIDDVLQPNDNDGELRGLLVNKHTLRLSSPVFRTMLADDSPFLESGSKTTNQDGKQVIKFEDDDMAAMEIVMNVIHLQNHKVPIRITITLFEEIAIVCDKYDIRCLGLWAEMWSKDYRLQDCSSLPRPLFIAWVFKLAEWFVRLTKILILETASSAEGELLLEFSSHFREGIPESILARIAEKRTELISQLLELCWQRSRKLRYTPEVCGIVCERKYERRNCDLVNLGSLTRHFPDLTSSPLDSDRLDSSSPLDILSQIRKMIRDTDTWPSNDHFTKNHSRCSVGLSLNSQAENIMNMMDGIELEAIATQAPPSQPTQLEPISSFLEQVNAKFGLPQFELVLRFTAIPEYPHWWQDVAIPSPTTSDTHFAWCPRFKCNYCPGFEYSLFQNEYNEQSARKALYSHLFNSTHIERFRRTNPGRSDLTGLDAALATRSPSTERRTVVRDFGWLGNYPPAP